MDLGFEATLDLLHHNVSFSAIFCDNDLIALGAMHALSQSGVSLLMDCPLTTIRQPIQRMGKMAVKMLIELIEEGALVQSPNEVVFSSELVVRKSCGMGQPILKNKA